MPNTYTLHDALPPSTDAVIVAIPIPVASTKPSKTVTTLGSEEAHCIEELSDAFASSICISPTFICSMSLEIDTFTTDGLFFGAQHTSPIIHTDNNN